MKKLGTFGYERIKGKNIEITPVSIYHQLIITEIAAQLYNSLNDTYIVIAGPVKLFLDEDNVFLPDVICFSKKQKQAIEADRIYRQAEWVCEILTPETAIADLEEKAELYFSLTNTQEYWTIDPYTLEAVCFFRARNNKIHKTIWQNVLKSAYLSLSVCLGTILPSPSEEENIDIL